MSKDVVAFVIGIYDVKKGISKKGQNINKSAHELRVQKNDENQERTRYGRFEATRLYRL